METVEARRKQNGDYGPDKCPFCYDKLIYEDHYPAIEGYDEKGNYGYLKDEKGCVKHDETKPKIKWPLCEKCHSYFV